MTGHPIRVRRRRVKGWRMPPDTVYVGRPSKWGNPFAAGRDGAPAECVRWFRLWLAGEMTANDARRGPALKAAIGELRGKNLACWCPLDRPCHADVLLELANR